MKDMLTLIIHGVINIRTRIFPSFNIYKKLTEKVKKI